jgi:hypothetical protein
LLSLSPRPAMTVEATSAGQNENRCGIPAGLT